MRVLVVEDNEDSRNLLTKQLRANGKEVITAVNGVQALEQAMKQPPDIVLSDIMMPTMDGFQLCHEWKQNERLKSIPFIFYTATYLSQNDEQFALSLGVDAFIRKPADIDILIKVLDETFEKVKTSPPKSAKADPMDLSLYLTEYNKVIVAKLEQKVSELEREITERKKAEAESKQNAQKLLNAMEATIEAIATTVETRDPYTSGHQRRVAKLSVAIANEIGLPEITTKGIGLASNIHDVGKMQVPADILSRPTKLNEAEYSIIKIHPQAGYDILKNIAFPWPIAQIVLQHHERLDRSGYPQGLSGDDILREAKILAVADVVEAMCSHRPYRPSLGTDKALEEISTKKGILYDIEAVEACIRIFVEKGFKFEQGQAG